jgi:hypothetical protein
MNFLCHLLGHRLRWTTVGDPGHLWSTYRGCTRCPYIATDRSTR